ncbi:hypothetical protein KY316_00890 [Candidatus Woesearchaeota archaeon]|nr:hypothetical protein [Candidatus Woesearchaeota archaeon]
MEGENTEKPEQKFPVMPIYSQQKPAEQTEKQEPKPNLVPEMPVVPKEPVITPPVDYEKAVSNIAESTEKLSGPTQELHDEAQTIEDILSKPAAPGPELPTKPTLDEGLLEQPELVGYLMLDKAGRCHFFSGKDAFSTYRQLASSRNPADERLKVKTQYAIKVFDDDVDLYVDEQKVERLEWGVKELTLRLLKGKDGKFSVDAKIYHQEIAGMEVLKEYAIAVSEQEIHIIKPKIYK